MRPKTDTAKLSLKLCLSAAALITVMLLISGCGGNSMDTGQVEKDIQTLLHKQVGADVTSVSCPDNVAIKKGSSFTCTAHASDGTQAPIVVTQTDDQGTVAPSAKLVVIKDLKASIKHYIKDHYKARTRSLKCPELVKLKTGNRFRCPVVFGKHKGKVVVVQKSGNHFIYSVRVS